MRHATPEDLDRLEALLVDLRRLPQLRERKRGYFSRGTRAFLHFHEDAGELYVDVRLDSTFQRMKVTSRSEQAVFLSRVQQALAAPLALPGLQPRPPGRIRACRWLVLGCSWCRFVDEVRECRV